jgi:hypothetical protein
MATTKTAKKPKKPAQPQPAETLSPHSTEAAFNAVKAQLDALSLNELSQPNFNLQEGAFVALAADALLREPETRAKIEALAKAGIIDLRARRQPRHRGARRVVRAAQAQLRRGRAHARLRSPSSW